MYWEAHTTSDAVSQVPNRLLMDLSFSLKKKNKCINIALSCCFLYLHCIRVKELDAVKVFFFTS